MNPNKINRNHVDFFQENGYLKISRFFSQEAVLELRNALDCAVASKRERMLGGGGETDDDYNRVFNQMVNLWVDYEIIRKYSFDTRLAEVARKISRCKRLVIYHDHGLIKPGGEQSKATNWHQDAPYWPMEQVGALSAWIALDDVNLENGCMQFIPGSHKYGRLAPVALSTEGASVLKDIEKTNIEIEVEPVVMEMEAGSVTFHHGCTFHYATPNQTSCPRRALAIIYIPEYVNYNGQRNAGGDPNLKPGEPFQGLMHPILASG